MSHERKWWYGARVLIDGKESPEEYTVGAREFYNSDDDTYRFPNHEDGWVHSSRITGFKHEGDTYAYGDRVVLHYDNNNREDRIGDLYGAAGKWADGRVGVVIIVDEYDDNLHYRVHVPATEAEQNEAAEAGVPRYVTRPMDDRGFIDGMWFSERYLSPAPAEGDGDLPSYNPEATVSESLGMWRPPKVTP
jgi:hypothetical protein